MSTFCQGTFFSLVVNELFKKLNFNAILQYTPNKKVNLKIFSNHKKLYDNNFVSTYEALDWLVYSYNLKEAKKYKNHHMLNLKFNMPETANENFEVLDNAKLVDSVLKKIKFLGRFSPANAKEFEHFIQELKTKKRCIGDGCRDLRDSIILAIANEADKTLTLNDKMSFDKYKASARDIFDDLF